MNDYEELKKNGFVGFAHKYLYKLIIHESKSHDEIDIHVYTKLVQLDSKLGTTASEQLYWLSHHSLRLDLLKVGIQFRVL